MTRSLFTSLAAAAAFALAAGAAQAQHDLTVVSWGGAYQDGQKEVFFKPFNATGTKLVDESWDGGLGVLRTKIKGGNNNWDVVQVEADELEVGCDEGLYEKLDVAKIGGAARYLPGTVHACGVGAIIYNLVLAYDGDKTKTAPAGWADFFDTKKFPGKRSDPQRREVEPRSRADRRRRAERRTSTRCCARPKASSAHSRSSTPSSPTWCSGRAARSRRRCWPPATWSSPPPTTAASPLPTRRTRRTSRWSGRTRRTRWTAGSS